MKKIVFCVLMTWVAFANGIVARERSNSAPKAASMPKVLVVAPSENVKSDYYVKEMLTEGTGINKDSVCYTYNNVIANVLQQVASKENLVVLNGCGTTLLNGIKLSGEGENAVADISGVDKQKFSDEMRESGASFLLVLDQHYLKYQELPFRTMFHFVNYTLYDANERKLGQGRSYFTSFEPQSAKDMSKSSLKSSKKMIAEISKIINVDNN